MTYGRSSLDKFTKLSKLCMCRQRNAKLPISETGKFRNLDAAQKVAHNYVAQHIQLENTV